MKKKLITLLSFVILPMITAFSAIEVIAVDWFTLSSDEPSQALLSVDVQAGDVIVWSHSDNKKFTAAGITFGASTAGSVVVDEFGLVTDFGVDAGIGAFTVINAHDLLGQTDPNPTAFMAYLPITATGTYDFWVSSDSNITSADYLFIVRSDSSELTMLDSDAEAFDGDMDVTLTLEYALDGSEGDTAIIESYAARKGEFTPEDTTVVWSSTDDGGDPIAYLPSQRMHAAVVTTGTSFTSDIQYAWDTTQEGKNSGSIVGLAIGETSGGGSGGDTWFGYEIPADGWIDTVPWMGYVNVLNDPWVYSAELGSWVYVSSDQSVEAGAWVYVTK